MLDRSRLAHATRWLRASCGSAARRFLDAAVLALAVVAGMSLAVGLIVPAYDVNRIWVGGGGEGGFVDFLVGGFAVAVLLRTRCASRRVHAIAAALAGGLAVACACDVVEFYDLALSDSLSTRLPVPLSVGMLAVLTSWAWLVARAPRPNPPARQPLLVCALALAATCVFGLAHITTFGATDYRRPADVAVVFGAAVRPDGSPSLALYDRTKTACDLYHQGLVRHLLLSGGRAPAAGRSEPSCMAAIARGQGVPEDALILDDGGVSTGATLDAVASLAVERGWERVLLVSHDYHLARIHIAAHRRGLAAYTVPARESRALAGKSRFVLRELAALAWYTAANR